MARLHGGFLLLVAWAVTAGQSLHIAAESGTRGVLPHGGDVFAASADFGRGRVGRVLSQISAQEAVKRSKEGKALFPTLNGGSTSEEDIAQTEDDARQAFSLDSLGDPMCAPHPFSGGLWGFALTMG
jgi:hypothetical protein